MQHGMLCGVVVHTRTQQCVVRRVTSAGRVAIHVLCDILGIVNVGEFGARFAFCDIHI
jgi:hypothetical protein